MRGGQGRPHLTTTRNMKDKQHMSMATMRKEAEMKQLHDEAHRLVDLGYSLCPIHHGGKTPLVKWGDIKTTTHDDVDHWLAKFHLFNIAILTGPSGVICLDADTPEAVAWIRRNCPRTPMVARTPRGGYHAYYKAVDESPPRVNILGMGLDVRAGRSILTASPSWSSKHKRPWRWEGDIYRPNELPGFPSGLLPREPERVKPRMPIGERRASGGIKDVSRWIMKVKSVQGQNGSDQCFKVACKLVESDMSEDRIWDTLLYWNSQCAEPPWSEAELRHKLDDAFKRLR